jgi:hypothetical protein
MSEKYVLLTSGTSWTVPADFNSSNNRIVCIGGGAGGGRATNGGSAGAGGGGGALSYSNNVTLVAGSVYTYSIGSGGAGGATSGGTGGAGGDTWIRTNVTGAGQSAPASTEQGILAKGGSGAIAASTTLTPGGNAALGYGQVTRSGGAGGGAAPSIGVTDKGGAGGGSAATLNLDGFRGGNVGSSATAGSAGGGGVAGVGADGESNRGGFGGLNQYGFSANIASVNNGYISVGVGGGGGSGIVTATSGYTVPSVPFQVANGGGLGITNQLTPAGPGGGGGGGGGSTIALAGGWAQKGGLYGGGGGGGGGGDTTGNGGVGGQGCIIISYDVVSELNIIALTSGTTWTVPANISACNMIICVGAGGGASRGVNGGPNGNGAGGGACSVSRDFNFTPGSNVFYSIGSGGVGATTSGGTGTSGGDTWLNWDSTSNTSLNTPPTSNATGVLAKGGANGTVSGSGGNSSLGFGNSGLFRGGNGRFGGAFTDWNGYGGGSSATFFSDGFQGGIGDTNVSGGGGGGGIFGDGYPYIGIGGFNELGSYANSTVQINVTPYSSQPGANGGGGAGGTRSYTGGVNAEDGQSGGNGTWFTLSNGTRAGFGGGGGGGGGSQQTATAGRGGNGGLYGGGGGGGGGSSTTGNGGDGAQGVIFIIYYTPSVRRDTGGAFLLF